MRPNAAGPVVRLPVASKASYQASILSPDTMSPDNVSPDPG